jgi:histidyl-tRNA synthetase
LVRICNPEGPLSSAFVGEVYARYPPSSHPEYGQACVKLAEAEKAVEDAIANCDIIGMCDASGEQKNAVKKATPGCNALRAREADAAAGLNAQIPFADAPFLPVVCVCVSFARALDYYYDMMTTAHTKNRTPRPRICIAAGGTPTTR